MQVMIGKTQSGESTLSTRALSSSMKNSLPMKQQGPGHIGHNYSGSAYHHMASLKTTKKKCGRILPGFQNDHEVLLDYEIKKNKISSSYF